MSAVPSLDPPSRLAARLASAGLRARATGRPILVSVVEAVRSLDPLAVLAAVEQAADIHHDIAGLLASGHMFWAHPAGQLALASIGAVATVSPTGAHRFTEADREWRALLETAMVDGTTDGARAIGPLLMGGFSFEPDGPRSELWRDFPSTHLAVPALLVTADAGRTFLTTSVLVAADGTPSITPALLAALRAIVLGDTEPLVQVPARPHVDEHAPDLTFADLRPASEWRTVVRDAVAAIHDDELQKVVLARAVQAAVPDVIDPIALLDHLRSAHRDGYLFGIWRGERAFVGASPERLVRLDHGMVDASSLAGSAPRGATPSEDAALAANLLSSAKERAEHAMVRGALVEALGMMCDEITADEEPSLLALPHVQHLHTAVRARLLAGHSLLDLAGALHPTPAVGGTPREAALAFIREHEQLDRGWYAAPIGWIGRDAGELAVALRSTLVHGAEATLFAGCGIVAGSDPARELSESRVKLQPMQLALAATLASSEAAPLAGLASERGA
jgi:isochorismate synthase